jgi:hypothetical protein
MIEIAPTSTKQMTYDEAVLYCYFLEYEGHNDWRLPTLHEYYNHVAITSWHNGQPVSQVLRVTPVRDVC